LSAVSHISLENKIFSQKDIE